MRTSAPLAVLALVMLGVVGCDLFPFGSQSLAERVASSGQGYVFEPLGARALPAGAISADDARREIAEYSDGRFAVQRMEFGELCPNVEGPCALAYVAEIVDGLHPERGDQLMFIHAENGEIIGAPGL